MGEMKEHPVAENKENKAYERLKKELYEKGSAALSDFIGTRIGDFYDREIVDVLLDGVYAQMPVDTFQSYLEKYDIKSYTVAFAVDARYYANVYCTSMEEAKEAGRLQYMECDIGELEHIDMEYVHTEDAEGNIIDEY